MRVSTVLPFVAPKSVPFSDVTPKRTQGAPAINLSEKWIARTLSGDAATAAIPIIVPRAQSVLRSNMVAPQHELKWSVDALRMSISLFEPAKTATGTTSMKKILPHAGVFLELLWEFYRALEPAIDPHWITGSPAWPGLHSDDDASYVCP